MLLDQLPCEVVIDGYRYPINTDYRYSVMFEMLMLDNEVPERSKLDKALKLYYPTIPRNLNAAIDKIMWFYRCGKEERPKRSQRNKRRSPDKRVYDYDFDDSYIYSAFLQQYGVDLQDEEIHWWKFRAMFKSLGDDTEFVKIMGYRSMTISNNMTKSQKEFYQDMKRIHALPAPKGERQKDRAIEYALLHGGDLSKITQGVYTNADSG